MKDIKVGIIGVSGYTGLELVKILINHPRFDLVYAANSDGETTLAKLHPCLDGIIELNVQKAKAKEAANACELVFLALPHKTAMQTAKELLLLGVRVVDLSADYRVSKDAYEANYCPHEDLENLSHAVYSIPELHKEAAKDAKLIANPGCHVTASLLALAPFLPHIDLSQPIFIESKTGLSGAGKTPSNASHYTTANENLNHYNIIKHRHACEINEHASRLFGKKIKTTFIPTLVPLTRGMLASVYATLIEPIEPLSIIRKFYEGDCFVRIKNEPPHVKSVAGTHFADMFAAVDGKALMSFCAIDNLLRGASSQAVANANIMMKLPKELGLPNIAYAP